MAMWSWIERHGISIRFAVLVSSALGRLLTLNLSDERPTQEGISFLYEQSRKVLALCIVVAVVILVVTCVSLNLAGNNDPPSRFIGDSVAHSGQC